MNEHVQKPVIIPAGDQSTEGEVKWAVLNFLETCAYGEAPFVGSRGLFFNVPKYIKLTPIDREVSRSRDAEMKYYEIIRNVYRTGIREGLFVKRKGVGLQLASRVKNSLNDFAKHGASLKGNEMSDVIKREVKLHEAPPLPTNIADWTRFMKAERTLNDLVEDIHRVLVNEDDQYRAYLRAVYDAHAIEGSLAADNVMAAMIIRDKAKETQVSDVANEKLAIINLALGVVLRRYHASRKQRRNMIAGEEVPADNNNE